MKKNEKGFSPFLIIVALLLFGFVCAVGWYVFNRHDKTSSSQVSTSNGTRKRYENLGPAMEPTYRNGEIIYGATKLASEVKRGDIIVVVPPSHNVYQIVKRVVGLLGDKVVVGKGKITVTTSEGAIYDPGLSGAPEAQSINTTVKAQSFYVVGDNLSNSLDSRVESFGQIPFADLLAVIEQ